MHLEHGSSEPQSFSIHRKVTPFNLLYPGQTGSGFDLCIWRGDYVMKILAILRGVAVKWSRLAGTVRRRAAAAVPRPGAEGRPSDL